MVTRSRGTGARLKKVSEAVVEGPKRSRPGVSPEGPGPRVDSKFLEPCQGSPVGLPGTMG